jgi:hypothetical protein
VFQLWKLADSFAAWSVYRHADRDRSDQRHTIHHTIRQSDEASADRVDVTDMGDGGLDCGCHCEQRIGAHSRERGW